ncbi:hypothetical protein BDL97_06G107700 [Sphagnum fallax]|nr:hypothetical protein BDL97_06G107700 [Sphagnum fallax]
MMSKGLVPLGDHLDFEISSQPTAAGVMQDEDFGVAMTASMDPSGHLLLGSSREFTGFDVGTRNEVLECIMRQASKFLPALADVSLQQAIGSGRVRTGLRPYGWFQTFQLYSLIHRKNWTGL